MPRKAGGSARAQRFDIHHVASLASVSIATVSRTMNGVGSVDPELAARVWRAIETLHYVPNTQARALVSGRSRMLGLLVSEITNPFFPELIQEFEGQAVQQGYELLIASTSYDRAKMHRSVRRMLERDVEGVAIMTFGIDEGALEAFASGHVRTVFVDAAPPLAGSSFLTVDYRKGIHEAVAHLAALGHRDLAFLSGPLRLRSAVARRAAFEEGLALHGLALRPEWMVEGDHTMEGAQDAMRTLLRLPERPTALMCSNDMTAIGVQHALFASGHRVPEDFSLVGFDDIHLAAYTIPPLTTVRMAPRDLAQAAIRRLLAKPADAAAPEEPPAEIIPTTLVLRQTTGAPRPQR